MQKSKRYSKLNIGVIGVGVMGNHHARILSKFPGVTLAGIFDANLDRAKEIAEKYGTKSFETIEALLSEVSAVVIASPTQTHFEVAMMVVERGVHLFIEKPITSSSHEGKMLVDAAAQKKLVLAIGHIERFNPAFIAAEKILNREKPLILNIKRFSPFPERITDASVIIDMMIHDIDLAKKLARSKVDSLKASGKKVKTKKLDLAQTSILFENGLIAHIEADRTYESKVRRIEAICENITLIIDLLEKKVVLKKALDPAAPIDVVPEEEIPVQNKDQLTAELKDFVAAVKRGKTPKTTGQEGLEALVIAEEVEAKALKNRRK